MVCDMTVSFVVCLYSFDTNGDSLSILVICKPVFNDGCQSMKWLQSFWLVFYSWLLLYGISFPHLRSLVLVPHLATLYTFVFLSLFNVMLASGIRALVSNRNWFLSFRYINLNVLNIVEFNIRYILRILLIFALVMPWCIGLHNVDIVFYKFENLPEDGCMSWWWKLLNFLLVYHHSLIPVLRFICTCSF